MPPQKLVIALAAQDRVVPRFARGIVVAAQSRDVVRDAVPTSRKSENCEPISPSMLV